MFEAQDYAAAMRGLRGERTQKQCAAAAGIDRPAWSGYEGARVIPKRTNYQRIARGLGVTEDDLTEAVIAAWRERTGRGEETSVLQSPQGVLIVALGPGSVLLSTPPLLEVTSV